MTAAITPSGEIILRRVGSDDLPGVLRLLREARLPLDGVPGGLADLIVAEADGEVVGAAGMERYGTSALLRSVAVSPRYQGRGIARALVEQLLEAARCDCIHDVYLRTTTAEEYFPRFGFAPVAIEEVPLVVQDSVEFQGACPATAVTMVCPLGRAEGA